MSCRIIFGAVGTPTFQELQRMIALSKSHNPDHSAIIIDYHSQTPLFSDPNIIHLRYLADFNGKDAIIGIENGHLFADINEEVRRWVLKEKRHVIISSAICNDKLELAGNLYKLLPICEAGAVTIIGITCQCCRGAGGTFRHQDKILCLDCYTGNLGSSAGCSLILGAMFAGKSTELLRRLKIEHDTGAKVILINSEKDSRCGKDEISTHSSLNDTKNDGIKKIKRAHLRDFTEADEYDIIGIDEGQFFDDMETVYLWVLKKKKTVIVAGLIGSFSLENFGHLYQLLPLCSAGGVSILGGRCTRCLKHGVPRTKCIGSFSSLKHDIESSPTGDNILIGGKETYETLCLKCHPVSAQ